MASVAKWLRHRVVVPSFAGSSPVIRPKLKHLQKNYEKPICVIKFTEYYVTLSWA